VRFHGSDHPHAKLLEINALPVRLQKAVFQLAKGGLLQAERRPFARQYAAYCNIVSV